MQRRVTLEKIERVRKYEVENTHLIEDLNFKPLDLVLVRNTIIENSLDRKMKPRYLGPMVVITRNRGGSYVLAELNGAVWQEKVVAFRVVHYHARNSITLKTSILEFIDLFKEGLAKLADSWDSSEDDGPPLTSGKREDADMSLRSL